MPEFELTTEEVLRKTDFRNVRFLAKFITEAGIIIKRSKVINKTDLAPTIGADLGVMECDALWMRDGGSFVFAQVKHGVGIEEIVDHVLQAWEAATGEKQH